MYAVCTQKFSPKRDVGVWLRCCGSAGGWMGLGDSQVSGTCRDRHTPEGPWVAQTGQGPSDGPGQNENTSLSLAWGRMQLSINQAGRYGWAGSEKQETGHEESWQGEEKSWQGQNYTQEPKLRKTTC